MAQKWTNRCHIPFPLRNANLTALDIDFIEANRDQHEFLAGVLRIPGIVGGRSS